MKKNLLHPFDKFFKSMLSMRRTAEELLHYCLPNATIDALNLSTLAPMKETHLDENLRESFADVVYACATHSGHNTRICFLFEHKSEKPASPVTLQLLRYMLNIWETDSRQKRTLGPIVPIVIYHGHDNWQKETLSDHIKPAKAFRAYVPNFDFVFLNLRAMPDNLLLKRRSGLVESFFLLLKYAREEQFLRQNFSKIVILPNGGPIRQNLRFSTRSPSNMWSTYHPSLNQSFRP